MDEMTYLAFKWPDYLIFGILLGGSLILGVFFGFCSKQDSVAEYLFGGKHMGYFPVAVSMLASMLSGITLLGVPTEIYLHGAQYITTIITVFLLSLITIYIFMPVYQKLELTSTYEYLELRFSRRLRSFASSMYIISLLLHIPIVIYVPSLVFSQVTDYNLHIIAPLLSIICITYTTMGGVKAVIWIDTIQFIFTLGGLVTVMILGILSAGGLAEVWKIADDGGRLDVFDFNPNPFVRNSFWGLTVGLLFTWLSSFAIGQKFMQRLLSIEKKIEVKKAIWCTTIGSIIVNLACIFTGILIYVKYHKCDPLTAKLVERNDQIVPFYVMDIAGKISGLPGVFLAGVVSASLSTMSATLNTLSGIIYKDFIEQYVVEDSKKDAKAANIMKGISVVTGIITIGLIFVIEHMGTIFEMAISLRSIVEGPLLGVFVLGMMFPVVGKKGALYGGLVSLFVMTWIVVGSKWHVMNKRIQYPNLPMSTNNCSQMFNVTISLETPLETLISEDEPLFIFQLSMLYLVFYGTIIVVLVGLIISFFNGEWNSTKVNPDHITPIVQRFLSDKKYTEVAMHEISLQKGTLK